MSLIFKFLAAVLMCSLSLALQQTAISGNVQPVLDKPSDELLAESLKDHPEIFKLIASARNHLLSKKRRLGAMRAAITEAELENDRDLELRTLIISLEVCWTISKNSELKKPLDRAVELNNAVGNSQFAAFIQILQGRYMIRLLRYRKAIDFVKKAQASKLLPKRDLARSYNYLTFLYGRLGMVKHAFDASRKTIALYDIGERSNELAIAQSNFAWMFVRTKRFDKAEQLYNEMAFGPEDKPYCWSLVGRCEIALYRKNFDRVMQLVQLGLKNVLASKTLNTSRKRQLSGTFHLMKSRCLFAEGKFLEAESVCERAIQMLPPTSHRMPEARAQLGLIVARNGSPQRAIEMVRKAIDDAQVLRGCRLIDKVHVQLFASEILTKLYSENDRIEEAYAQLKKTKQIRKSLTVEDLVLQLKLSNMRRQNEIDEQRLDLIKTEEQAKTAQAELVAANAIAEAEKSKVIRNVIVTAFILTLLGGIGYWFSEKRRRQVQYELKETKEEAEYQAQLSQKKRIEDIGQLTGSVAHDFNNVLQVFSQTGVLFEGLLSEKLTAQQKELLEKKDIAVTDAAKITKQLLTYSRRQAITPKVALVSTMLQSTEALFDSISDLIQVNILNFDETLAINVDQHQFSSSILNLLLNASDSMEGKGLVDVKVSEQLVDESNSLTLKAGEYVRIEVLDAGKGMTQEQLERACEPFFTTKTQTTGTGLGLSSVKGFVEQAGGAISLQSRPNGGTIVALYFPKMKNAVVQSASTVSESTRLSEDDRVCLIVEDNIEARTSLALMMESFGFDCTSCSSADEASTLLELGHEFSLVLADVHLPGIWNGVELAEWIRFRFPSIRVVLISGHDPPSNLEGFNFLRKPIRFLDLRAKLKLERV